MGDGISEEGLVNLFYEKGVILSGHFVFKEGDHSGIYIAHNVIYSSPLLLNIVKSLIADRFTKKKIHIVIGPADGGNILARKVAENIICAKAVKTAKRSGSQFEIEKKDESFVANKNVLIVEDVITTGSSVKGVIREVRRLNGRVVGIGAIWNRGSNKNTEGVKISALINRSFISYPKDGECLLCNANISINTDHGHGKEFLESKKREDAP